MKKLLTIAIASIAVAAQATNTVELAFEPFVPQLITTNEVSCPITTIYFTMAGETHYVGERHAGALDEENLMFYRAVSTFHTNSVEEEIYGPYADLEAVPPYIYFITNYIIHGDVEVDIEMADSPSSTEWDVCMSHSITNVDYDYFSGGRLQIEITPNVELVRVKHPWERQAVGIFDRPADANGNPTGPWDSVPYMWFAQDGYASYSSLPYSPGIRDLETEVTNVRVSFYTTGTPTYWKVWGQTTEWVPWTHLGNEPDDFDGFNTELWKAEIFTQYFSGSVEPL
jgi:hypothetical protein